MQRAAIGKERRFVSFSVFLEEPRSRTSMLCIRYTENITIGGWKFSGTNFEVLSWNFDTGIHSLTTTIYRERAQTPAVKGASLCLMKERSLSILRTVVMEVQHSGSKTRTSVVTNPYEQTVGMITGWISRLAVINRCAMRHFVRRSKFSVTSYRVSRPACIQGQKLCYMTYENRKLVCRYVAEWGAPFVTGDREKISGCENLYVRGK